MAYWVKVAEVGDIAADQGKVIEIGGTPVALFNVAGTFYAIDNVCLHMGGPLGEGILKEAVVTCPWHGWQYDVKTGALLGNPAVNVQSYEVKIENDAIYLWMEVDQQQQQREQEIMKRIEAGESLTRLAEEHQMPEADIQAIYHRRRVGERLVWLGERYLKTGRISALDLLNLPYRDIKPITYGVIDLLDALLRSL